MLGALSLPAALGLAAEASPASEVEATVAKKGKSRDFGDAPDGRRAGYVTKPGVKGRFPSKKGSRGASHRKPGKLLLGRRSDREADSKQVDRDRGDDGFVPQLVPCETSRLRFIVDASRLKSKQLKKGRAYLNAWFDWTADGDWRDKARCPPLSRPFGASASGSTKVPEWAVKNVKLKLKRFRKDPIQIVEVETRAGPQIRDLWYRASLTLDQKFAKRVRIPGKEKKIRNDGRGRFKQGETEDTLLHQDPDADCFPGFQWRSHDFGLLVGAGNVSGSYEVDGQAPVSAKSTNALPPKGWVVTAAPGGWTVTFPTDPPEAAEGYLLTFELVSQTGRTVTVGCVLVVVHGVTPPATFPPGGDGDGIANATEITDTIACPDNVDDPPVEHFFDFFIPEDAVNVRHEFVQPRSGPLCPGTTDGFPGLLSDPPTPPPDPPTPPAGERVVRVKLESLPSRTQFPPDTSVDGPPQAVTVRVTWE